ncbi:MAG: hypothetical protein C3F08_10120 [Candidatus Methylomirabilota bacterium]|nr:MAG: hypothetical protein C3F08_10120 [candidate division NC10 bacterium]
MQVVFSLWLPATGEGAAGRRWRAIFERIKLDFDNFEVLTFDRYGTLIDWKVGIRETLRPVLARHHIDMPAHHALELYAE